MNTKPMMKLEDIIYMHCSFLLYLFIFFFCQTVRSNISSIGNIFNKNSESCVPSVRVKVSGLLNKEQAE